MEVGKLKSELFNVNNLDLVNGCGVNQRKSCMHVKMNFDESSSSCLVLIHKL